MDFDLAELQEAEYLGGAGVGLSTQTATSSLSNAKPLVNKFQNNKANMGQESIALL
jgi:hypothetical protein